jgi:hypothetical protein
VVARNLRAEIIAEGRRDAKAFFGEESRALGPDETELDWVKEAWADIRRDFKLGAGEAKRLWPVYWKALQEATVKLAAPRKRAR